MCVCFYRTCLLGNLTQDISAAISHNTSRFIGLKLSAEPVLGTKVEKHLIKAMRFFLLFVYFLSKNKKKLSFPYGKIDFTSSSATN